jgi:4-methylaminobutanoate oxidase (formaldehyde-forming)
MRHQYVVTDPLADITEGITTVRDPDRIVYFRPKGSALLVGGYARQPVLDDGADPLARPRTLYPSDLERFAESWQGAQTLLPLLRGRAAASVVHGPEAFTPDGEFILGETEVAGLWVGAGFCVHGIAGAGGVGKVLAEWIVDGQPEHDVSQMDIRRFGAQHRSSSYVRARALDAYSRYYDIVYPGEERLDENPLRVSPVYPRLLELEASFGEKAGWRRPNWLSANANAAAADFPRPAGWPGHSWSPAIGAECLGVRDAAALFDQSSFGKLTAVGPDAAATLERVCANRIDRPIGSVVYTQILNQRGGIEADVTVTRVGEEAFRVVTGTASPRRDLTWIARQVTRGARVELTDISGSEACLCLWGPQSEAILSAICDDDIASDSFRFLTARRISVSGVPALAQRVSYVGEYGWELHCPAEYGLRLWDALFEAGRSRGLIAAGYRAIDSLRIEKGYRVWGSDITPVTTPDEGGLRFAVAIDKPGGFIGRDALVDLREQGGPEQRLRALVLEDPQVVCLGNEPIRIDGELAGRVTSGAYGHRIERSVAYGYLPADVLIGAAVEIGIFATWMPATVTPEPLYDPEGARLQNPAAELAVAA